MEALPTGDYCFVKIGGEAFEDFFGQNDGDRGEVV